MPQSVLWISALLLGLTAAALLISEDWRWSLGLLVLQYFGAFWLMQVHWQLSMSAASLVTGWMSAAALAMTELNLSPGRTPEIAWPSGRLFRIFASGLVFLAAMTAAEGLSTWLPSAGFALILGALLLAGLGLLHLGMTMQPLRVILGLLTTLLGFEIIFSAVEGSFLVAALLAVVKLGLALAGCSLLIMDAQGESA